MAVALPRGALDCPPLRVEDESKKCFMRGEEFWPSVEILYRSAFIGLTALPIYRSLFFFFILDSSQSVLHILLKSKISTELQKKSFFSPVFTACKSIWLEQPVETEAYCNFQVWTKTCGEEGGKNWLGVLSVT